MRNYRADFFKNGCLLKASSLGILTLLFLPCLLTAGILEYEFSPVWRAEYSGVIARDLNADSVDELIMSRENKYEDLWGVSCTDMAGGARWQYWSKQRTEVEGAADLDNDGELEVIARERAGDTAFLLVFGKDGKLIERIKVLWGNDRDHSGEWDGNFGFKGAVDLNGDGKKELLLSAGTSFDLEPRGVFVLDPSSGSQLWNYWVGFYPNDIKYDDLDADGDLEIVIGGASPANGSEIVNKTDDIHTYVVVLDNQGQLIWMQQIGGAFSATRTEIADFDEDGKKEIAVIETTENADFEGRDRVIIFDGATGKKKRQIAEGQAYRGSLLCDINNDSIPEIITGNTDGIVRAYDGNLREVASFKYKGEIEVCEAGDLDAGWPKIIAASLDGKLHILNHNLKPVGSYEAREGYRVGGHIVTDKGNVKRILMYFVQPSGEVEYSLLGIGKKLSRQTILLLIFILLVLALLVVGGVIIPILSRRNKVFRNSLDKSTSGIILLSTKGQVKVINNTAREILELKNGISPDRLFNKLHIGPQTKEIQKVILESICLEEQRRVSVTIEQETKERLVEVQTFKTGTKLWLVSLSDITEQEYGRRVATLMPVAQQLAHGIKNPLNNIKLALQRLQKFITTSKEKQDEASRYSTMASEEAERLIKLTNGFMRFTKLDPPEFKPTSLKGIIEEVVNRFRQMLSGDVDIKVDCEETLPKLMLDAAQMSIVIDYLVDNAIAAVGAKGQISINASLRERVEDDSGKTKEAEIRVRDTGTGIPEKYKERIFEPYFSLKEGGTGLGLCMAKKIVENHGGVIFFESSKGKGTTFIIRLPLVKE